MANTILDNEATVEALGLSTSLDPYGQLVKMLMPRALSIAIYDRMGVPLWLSDGCDNMDLLQLAEEGLNAARSGRPDPEERDGFARSWEGDTAYVFILRDGDALLGALALSCQDGAHGARPFSVLQGLLRPALQVLSRELANQYQLGDLRKDLTSRNSDLALFMDASGVCEGDSDDLQQFLTNCVSRLGGAVGVLLIPDKKIELLSGVGVRSIGADALDALQRHLFAWVQVQRRTLMLNKTPPNGPLSTLPYKMLACPIRHGAQQIDGLLALLRPMSDADFDMRQVRLLEMLSRRAASVLQNAYDVGTGLLTRPAFEQRALAALATVEAGAPHCVAYGDIDRLHVINDNYGMHVGDAAIANVAEVLRLSLPPQIFAARIAGDRFALFFPSTQREDAEPFVEELRGRVSASDFSHEGSPIELTMSFGLAAVSASQRLPLSHALACAEATCRAQKAHGGMLVQESRVAAAPQDPAYEAHEAHEEPVEASEAPSPPVVRAPEDPAMLNVVREAIANDRFRMDAQPIVSLASNGPARRFELLLRMIDAAGESVAPGKFLSAAERSGLANGIDRWVIQYALEILSSAAPTLASLGAHFTINISAQSLGDEAFPDYLEAKLREYELPSDLLSFEIAETAAVANIVRAETLIRRLRQLGHVIALDDFGRGLSSLNYLKSLSASDLKIDGGLIRDAVSTDARASARAQQMITAIVQLAHNSNLRTTAECVESEAILHAVEQLGVDYGQGFAIGRPRPLETVLAELLKSAPGVARSTASARMARLGALSGAFGG